MTIIPFDSGFRSFRITYTWLCAACEGKHHDERMGRPGDAVWIPSVPAGWSITKHPEGWGLVAYCPRHVVEISVTPREVGAL